MTRNEPGHEPLDDNDDLESVDSLLREAMRISEPGAGTTLSFLLLPGEVLAERFVVETSASASASAAFVRQAAIEPSTETAYWLPTSGL